MPTTPSTGLVLSGGGARGAYEAGAISVLAPALQAREERPSLLVGTSAGAINAAYLAASAHGDAAQQVEGLLDRWRQATKDEVIRPILRHQMPMTALRYAGELLSLPRVRLASLLDPKPLEGNLHRWVNWPDLHHNVATGVLEAFAVIATAARSGRTVVFVENSTQTAFRHSHALEYVHTKLAGEHVRASAAIPILFPPVRIDTPTEVRGWYVDGGTRLNTPIKPALDLGADRLVVIGTEAVTEPGSEGGRHESAPPDFGDAALHALHGALVDPLADDIRKLGNINMFFAEADRAPEAVRYRAARGKQPYRQVPYIFVAPARHGLIGDLATEVFRARYQGIRALRSPDFPALNRMLGGESPVHGELLSYLFFDREFIERLIQLGQQDARCWLESPERQGDPWRLEPLDAFVG
jgi:NTE family protein